MSTVTAAKIILDSVSPAGARITTMQLVYPRFIHAEGKTHRIISIGDNTYEVLQEIGFMDCDDFSRNASSSRAIPVAKMIAQVRNDPAMPIHWGSNQPGMRAGGEVESIRVARSLWRHAAKQAAQSAEAMAEIGLHKQVANRVLEPFQWMHTIVTATEWDNFFKLRLHPAADPNIYRLAQVMSTALMASTPQERNFHAPYADKMGGNTDTIAMVSAARCARVSYLNHDGSAPDVDKDLALAKMLRDSGHASPFEHVAFASMSPKQAYANFTGWQSFRSNQDI